MSDLKELSESLKKASQRLHEEGYVSPDQLAASVKLFNAMFPTSKQVEKAIQSVRRMLRGET